ncbi:MAG: ABC transporter ATP-binding protein [Planctomycetes bacterium]|nr:ABC transporter ATP-binding protein [Planctomycetota bacterium]
MRWCSVAEPVRLAVATDGVTKVFGRGGNAVHALRGAFLEVPYGELVMLVGPSGCGKTTLISILAGILDRTEGRCEVLGVDPQAMSQGALTRWRGQNIGFVFQQFNLIPVLTAVENVELPLLLAGVRSVEARGRAEETLDRVGLGHRTRHRPNELSGGEQQRVTIARALAGRPRLVWADEPTGALDSETADSVMGLLDQLHRDGLTLMLVTHDPAVGARAQRLIRMRDGRIESDETNATR